MNHKILEQIKGGAFLAGDLPMSTSSLTYDEEVLFFKFQKIRFLTRDLTEALRIPAGSRWNIGLKSVSFAFVSKMFDRKTILFNFFEDFDYVVTNGCYVFYTSCCSLACHLSIADWLVPFIRREYVDTCHINTWHISIGRSTLTEL